MPEISLNDNTQQAIITKPIFLATYIYLRYHTKKTPRYSYTMAESGLKHLKVANLGQLSGKIALVTGGGTGMYVVLTVPRHILMD
jgi:hypothetical protein